jgi:hypothetical protein
LWRCILLFSACFEALDLTFVRTILLSCAVSSYSAPAFKRWILLFCAQSFFFCAVSCYSAPAFKRWISLSCARFFIAHASGMLPVTAVKPPRTAQRARLQALLRRLLGLEGQSSELQSIRFTCVEPACPIGSRNRTFELSLHAPSDGKRW